MLEKGRLNFLKIWEVGSIFSIIYASNLRVVRINQIDFYNDYIWVDHGRISDLEFCVGRCARSSTGATRPHGSGKKIGTGASLQRRFQLPSIFDRSHDTQPWPRSNYQKLTFWSLARAPPRRVFTFAGDGPDETSNDRVFRPARRTAPRHRRRQWAKTYLDKNIEINNASEMKRVTRYKVFAERTAANVCRDARVDESNFIRDAYLQR